MPKKKTARTTQQGQRGALPPPTFGQPLLNNVLRPCTAPATITLLAIVDNLPIWAACQPPPVPRYSSACAYGWPACCPLPPVALQLEQHHQQPPKEPVPL